MHGQLFRATFCWMRPSIVVPTLTFPFASPFIPMHSTLGFSWAACGPSLAKQKMKVRNGSKWDELSCRPTGSLPNVRHVFSSCADLAVVPVRSEPSQNGLLLGFCLLIADDTDKYTHLR